MYTAYICISSILVELMFTITYNNNDDIIKNSFTIQIKQEDHRSCCVSLVHTLSTEETTITKKKKNKEEEVVGSLVSFTGRHNVYIITSSFFI